MTNSTKKLLASVSLIAFLSLWLPASAFSQEASSKFVPISKPFSARDKLKLTYDFQASYLPKDHAAIITHHSFSVPLKDGTEAEYKGWFTNPASYLNTTKVSFQIGLELYELFSVYGGMYSKQQPVRWNNWSPYQQLYHIGCDLHYTINEFSRFPITFQAFVYRYCSHPVSAWKNPAKSHQYDNSFNTSGLEIGLKVSGSVIIVK